MTIFEIRRKNLRRLIQINYAGNQSLFGRTIGRSESYVNRLLTDADYGKNLGELLARHIEGALSLPAGWFDKDDASLPEWRAVKRDTIDLVTSGEGPVAPQPPVRSENDSLAQIAADLAQISLRLYAVMHKQG